MIKIGRYEIASVVNGTVWLDGGAMHGVVPKVLWEESCEVDEQNRIRLATRTLLAVSRADERVVLVDTGCGPKWPPEKAKRYGIENDAEAIPRALASMGLSVDQVTDVVVTHLHFDHNGGLTDWFDDPDGRTVLRYPNARHWLHRGHWQHAREPRLKDQASFVPADFEGLGETGVLNLLEGENPPPTIPGIRWVISHGHTPYQLHPLFEGDEGGLLFVGDIIPTVAHLRLPWVMAYDLLPLTTIEEKRRFNTLGVTEGLGLAFPHDPKTAGVRIDGSVQRPIVAEPLPLELC